MIDFTEWHYARPYHRREYATRASGRVGDRPVRGFVEKASDGTYAWLVDRGVDGEHSRGREATLAGAKRAADRAEALGRHAAAVQTLRDAEDAAARARAAADCTRAELRRLGVPKAEIIRTEADTIAAAS